ncbi:MAG: DNA adenine methylase [Pirellulales bacterium]
MRGSPDVPHPIPYQGSKRSIAPAILAHLPHDIDRFVEPFAGSAAMSLAVAYRCWATSFWLNDGHAPLATVWAEIIDHPDRILRRYAELWNAQAGRERVYYDEVRDRFNKHHRPEHFLYLLARCVKACIRYNAEGQFNNSPDNRRKGARPEEMSRRIRGASMLLSGKTKVSTLDYKDVLAECREGDIVYMDPPYQGVCLDRDNRYAPKFEHDEFCEVLAELNRRNMRYLVSYDGRTGDKVFGKPLPPSLGLRHIEICAGRSTQATLLGRKAMTFESLYIAPSLADALNALPRPQASVQRHLTLG